MPNEEDLMIDYKGFVEIAKTINQRGLEIVDEEDDVIRFKDESHTYEVYAINDDFVKWGFMCDGDDESVYSTVDGVIEKIKTLKGD